MMASENKSLFKLKEEINDFAQCEFYTDRVDIKLNDANEAICLMEKFDLMDKIAQFEVKEKITLDGIKFLLDDKLTSLLIRKSGTEPLLRFYIESDKKEKLEKIKVFTKENV